MRIFVDESGDFAFPSDGRHDAYVLAGVICPNSEYPEVEAFVRDRCHAWGLPELHAKSMRPAQITEVASFICDRSLTAIAHVTDTELMDRALITDFRMRQAARIAESRDRWRARGGDSETLAAEIDQLIAAAGLKDEVSNPEFVQQHQLPLLILGCVQVCLDRFFGPEWNSDFETFDFVIDAKLPDALSPGERYSREIYKPVLGSSKGFSLELPPDGKSQADHPFRQFDHEDSEHTDLGRLFVNGLPSGESHDHAGLQLADIVANTVRRAVLKGPKSSTWKAFNLLRATLLTREGTTRRAWTIKPYWFTGGGREPDLGRYGPLLSSRVCPLS